VRGLHRNVNANKNEIDSSLYSTQKKFRQKQKATDHHETDRRMFKSRGSSAILDTVTVSAIVITIARVIAIAIVTTILATILTMVNAIGVLRRLLGALLGAALDQVQDCTL
jgi:dolichyl-phosphate-mannose--protein O-mannosyl transferase